MNIVMIMAGGVGKRFGANLPKQYLKINDKPVIDYVIEAANKSKLTDKILVVMDKEYITYSNYLKSGSYDIASNGKERYDSIKNGFDYINEHYDCQKVVIVDAVAPLLYPELIDDYFLKLDDYDAVITAQKITGALGNYNFDPLDREAYYMTQSPEGFNFKLIYNSLDVNFPSQELAWQLPVDSKKYLNFNFKNNLKLTYNFELKYASYLLDNMDKQSHDFTNIKDKSFFRTQGLSEYLLRIYPQMTEKWLDDVYWYYKLLVAKYGSFKNITVNQSSRYGLVMLVTDKDNNEYIIKMIPEFLNRYHSEKNAYRQLSPSFMCPLVETDDINNTMILKYLDPGIPADFNDNIALTNFFNKVFNNAKPYNSDLENFHDFKKQLIEKFNNCENIPFLNDETRNCLAKAIQYYDTYFEGKPLYLIHGDLRKDNILKHNNEYYAIDPIGYIAPLVFETARFIINDIDDCKNFEVEERLNLLVNYFSKWFDKKDIYVAVYIFTSFITYNSTFENIDDKQTKNYIKIMNSITKG